MCLLPQTNLNNTTKTKIKKRMQFWGTILQVVFVLSTIVAFTDCCSSRILLLREHTLNIVQHQHNFHNHLHEHAHQLQQQIEQHVADIVSQIEYNKTHATDQQQEKQEEHEQKSLYESITQTTPAEQEVLLPLSTTTLPSLDRPPPASPATPSTVDEMASVAAPPPNNSQTINLTTTATPKFHMQDFYYNIMRDVLSFECTGQYLTEFCLNGGRCFQYPVGNHSFFSCECADGYIGERCESKSLNELYQPTPTLDVPKPKILMARIVFSFPMLLLLSTTYVIFGAIIIFRNPNIAGKQTRIAGLFIT